MTNPAGIGVDPSVCYRHPGRQSWDLCQRCGRTVCPECQIAVPGGVHCPECVRELRGGAASTWRPANPARPAARRRPSRTGARMRSLLAADGDGPIVTRSVVAATLVLFVLGFAIANLPFLVLAALPGAELQVWRYLTGSLVYPSVLSFGVLLSIALNIVFFLLTGPQLERMLGLGRFLLVLAVSSVVGNACAVLAGGVGSGLTAPLFGLFAALLVTVWSDERSRMQILVMIGINLVLDIVASGGSGLPLLVGAMVGGAGTAYVLRAAPDRNWRSRTPALVIGGGTAAFVLLAVLRGLASL